MLITNQNYYNIDGSKIQRKVPIGKVYAFTKSMSCNEFILHVYEDYDYQFTSENVDLILEVLSYAYSSVTQKSIQVYEVPAKEKDMSKYLTTKEDADAFNKNKKDVLPDEGFRKVRDDNAIIRKSVKVIKSEKHGDFLKALKGKITD